MLILNFLSCSYSQEVLGLPRNEAAANLKSGNINFLLEADLPSGFSEAFSELGSVARIHPDAFFYAGVLAENNISLNTTGVISRHLLFYTFALNSNSEIIRREAAQKLILPCLKTADMDLVRECFRRLGNTKNTETNALRAACLYRLGRYNEIRRISISPNDDLWAALFPLLADFKEGKGDRVNLKEFFYTLPLVNNQIGFAIWEWAHEEVIRIEAGFFSEAEEELLRGRAAVTRQNYAQGLRFFRQVLAEDHVRDYFLPYPENISALGRTFQYAAGVQAEGIELFEEWIKVCDQGESLYRLLFYSGRIQRQRERYEESSRFFIAAADYAPDPLQKDTCLWYVFRNCFADQPENAAALIMDLIPSMSDPSYFTDIMERLSRQLVYTADWETMHEIYTMLPQGHNEAAAQFGYLLGRSVEEGMFQTDRTAESFFRSVYEDNRASLYYRILSANKLGLQLDPIAAPARKSRSNANRTSGEGKFILDFFVYGAEKFVLPYLAKYEEMMFIPELRKIAVSLSNSGNHIESINLCGRYMQRNDYSPDREDLLIYFPRHFQDAVESNAGREGLPPELLFGLVRTESAFMPDIASGPGAVGLGQFMLPTAMDMAARIARSEGVDYRINGQINLNDPEINLHLTAFYLRYLIDELGGTLEAVLAYNGGLGRGRRWRTGAAALPSDFLPEMIEFPETREYCRRVLSSAAMYGWLYYGVGIGELIADIYR